MSSPLERLARPCAAVSLCSVSLSIVVGIVVGAPSSAARAQNAVGAAPLACAVEGTGGGELRAETLCDALGRELGRPITRVDDARAVKRGDALQIIHGDVQWIVALLRGGKVRAWTRVSKTDAAGQEALFFARASRALGREAGKNQKACVRIDPNGGRKMRSSDLAYPWAELKRCRGQVAEVVDPWWDPSKK